ncbi:hypothetical protein [Xenorhabdus innexi]|uniref:Halovibrin n=1 Tax=Xenorhabdus innexi TaxID=290109 RepID=A0A1N6MTQ9_9GAMM|nr:hypothetical protein [Xenorhabdus innexi]PHM36875.1 hypothetical protein Xinn_01409 [Xenorhabdus innexi]SIP72236.1 exported hypothetical protein [Xenorhabdus innexi]
MKLKFKKYLSILISFISIPLFALNPPDISACAKVGKPIAGVIYKNPKVGKLIADRLNKRFYTIVSECGTHFSTPAYECSGVIIRSNSPDKTKFWEGGESFSYLRSDLNTYTLFKNRPTAYVINGRGSYKNPYGKQAFFTCAYPTDGYTVSRQSRYPYGCTESNLFPKIPGKCSTRKITNLEQWKADFNKISVENGEKRYAHQCSFNASRSSGTKEFELNLQARKSLNLNQEIYDFIHNEIIIKPWSEAGYKPQHIPVEAIIYTDFSTNPGVHPLRYAQAMQCSYIKATIDNRGTEKRVKYPIPIIYLDLESLRLGGRKNIFMYRERDQVKTKMFESLHPPALYFLKMI